MLQSGGVWPALRAADMLRHVSRLYAHPLPAGLTTTGNLDLRGYDHILFLLGVVFFLYHMKDVAIYVSLFAIGHSVTMLLGVWFGWGINAYIIDAIIGLSVVYKALDNLGAFQKLRGRGFTHPLFFYHAQCLLRNCGLLRRVAQRLADGVNRFE